MEMRTTPKKNYIGNYIIFFQAFVGMLGSLYFEHFGDLVANMQAWNLFPSDNWNPPCELCWWSRILLYPMVWFSGIALIRKDPTVVNSLLWVSLAWVVFSWYQYWYEMVNKEIYVEYLWFITMPMLAWLAFLVMFIIAIIVKRQIRNSK